jgi:hypothetical protein
VRTLIAKLTGLTFVSLALLAQVAAASCPKDTVFDTSVNIPGDAVMIVTHASSSYDSRLASKRGVEQAIRYARAKNMPLIYLADQQAASPEHFFIDDCRPNHWVYSKDGEISFDLRASRLYIVGGHLEVCLLNTVQDALSRWAKQPPHDLTITYFMDSIYSNGSEIAQSDPYHKDYMRFINVVSYGKPADEAWPKLTLLETMGLIVAEHRQMEYAQRVLPFYKRLLSADYRVEIKLNDAPPKVLQNGSGPRPVVMRFEFFDSAASLEKRNVGAQGT